MNYRNRTTLRLSVAACGLLAGVTMLAHPAAAQTMVSAADDPAGAAVTDTKAKTRVASVDAGEEQAIVVTGSRVARRAVDSSSPIQILDAKALDTRGFATLGEALNELPAFGVPGASPVGFNQSGFGAGQSFVNFLGLGSQRTLTLVNGRRFVSSNTSSIFGPTGSGGNQVDLNVIPTKLIDRVDIVAAIGAPIYGSDAIAGTINIILKKNFEGIDVDAENGITSRGDGQQFRIRALAGKNFGDGRGNITVSGEYSKNKGLLFTDRAVSTSDDRFDNPATRGLYRQVPYTDFRVPSISTSGIPLVGGAADGLDFPLSPQQSNVFFGDSTFNPGVNGANNSQLKFSPQGSLIPIDFGSTVGSPKGFSVFTSGGNGLNLRSVENLVTDLQRYNVTATSSYQLTDNIRLFGEGWYSVSEGRNLASQPVYNSALFGAAGTRDGNLIVPLNNPFLSAAARATILASIANNPYSDMNNGTLQPGHATQDYFYLGRANYDLSPGVSTGRVQVLRGVLGVDGDLHVLKNKVWKFEASANYGTSLTTSTNPELNQQNFLNAFNAVVDGSGNIACAPGYTNSAAPTISETCAPLNLFGNQISQAAKNYVTTIAHPRNLNSQADALLSVSGALVPLPGGDITFALGYEHREETSHFDPGLFYFGSGTGDSTTRGSYGRSTPIDPVYGKFHTNEVFGELNADIISPSNDIRFVHSLSFNSAARYIWNSLAGNDPTYTIGGRYAPVASFAFRGAYTRAVRAPSVTEAFNPKSQAYYFAVDPCDQTQIVNGPNPAARGANCAAAGVPAGFNALSNQRSFLGYSFGNPFLQNEKSDSYTAGVTFTPTFVRGLTVTADYVNVVLKNAISEFSASQVVAACYDSSNYPANQFCSLVQRDATHQISNVGTTYFNSAKLRYKGILADVKYQFATPFLGHASSVSAALNYQYLDTLTTEVTAGAKPRIDDNSVGYSRHKGTATFNYENTGFDYQLQVQYIGSANIDNNSPANFYSIQRYSPVAYVNMAVRYDVTPHLTVRASVDNILDTKPPYPYPLNGASAQGDPNQVYFQGILGTFVRVGAGVHF
jgi:outer membrane receptor protein involved in Fe transport